MVDAQDKPMKLGLTSIRSGVKRKFAAAQVAGDLIFSDTKVTILKTSHGIPFQLRYCPALETKPVNNKEDRPPPQNKPRFDPFENPSEELLIANVPVSKPTHALILNKYPVIPNHFILATRANLPQTDLLDPADLALTYACLQAWRDDHTSIPTEDNDLFAFFNSGPHSGASQPHRHLQFLPVGDMKLGLTAEDAWPWQPLMKDLRKPHPMAAQLPQNLKYNPNLPFLALTTPLSDSMGTPAKLYERYLFLLRAARRLSENPSASMPTNLEDDDDDMTITEPPESKHVSFSYNLALTLKHMAICPRRSESTGAIPGGTGDGGGGVALNGTVLAGTMMVKSARDWEALRRLDGGVALDALLGGIGFPPVAADTAAAAAAGGGGVSLRQVGEKPNI